MQWHKNFPVLIIDDEIEATNATGRALGHIVEHLQSREFKVLLASDYDDGRLVFNTRADLGCVIVDWDLCLEDDGCDTERPIELIDAIRARNYRLPIFLCTERLAVEEIPTRVLEQVTGYFWITEDTPDFIAGHIEQAAAEYVAHLLPPFFKELVQYAQQYKYAWHTPGHTGGVAFLKSPAGRNFFNFFGENTLRSDLSISVPELGSLLEHSEVVGQAERNAARAFGADQTYFVTNGTSTANKIVFHGRVTPGDVVLVDRNCHKSICHSLIMTRVIPVYLTPTRNSQGIIGPIAPEQFNRDSVAAALAANPLAAGKTPEDVAHVVITNSTYDGLCYHVAPLEQGLSGFVGGLHFDEAWYAYARFHPMYQGRFAMADNPEAGDCPLFATQSTHKLLAAFSQASMVHVKDRHLGDPASRVDPKRFNEAFMMHSSTSPQYSIIASLDVATAMMQHGGGRALIGDCIAEAVAFRRKLRQVQEEAVAAGGWFFSPWQPATVDGQDFAAVGAARLESDPACWLLEPGAAWHGFDSLAPGHAMLDPIKVTILCPGIAPDGTMDETGVPAALVSRFLESRGIVPEKTGPYCFLMLFSMGVTKGKSGTLLAELFQFQRHYQANTPLADLFEDLVEHHPERYGAMGLKDLADQMHAHYRQNRMSVIVRDVCDELPVPAMIPAEAYDHLVQGRVEEVPLGELEGRIAAAMVVPYPPGIPVIMPGERFGPETRTIVQYLGVCQEFDGAFPGFESENHGVLVRREDQGLRYYISCIR